MPDTESYSARYELLEALMEKASDDTYPSTAMLDMIEDLLTPDEIPGYAQWLTSRIREERFPSISMIRRAQQYV